MVIETVEESSVVGVSCQAFLQFSTGVAAKWLITQGTAEDCEESLLHNIHKPSLLLSLPHSHLDARRPFLNLNSSITQAEQKAQHLLST